MFVLCDGLVEFDLTHNFQGYVTGTWLVLWLHKIS